MAELKQYFDPERKIVVMKSQPKAGFKPYDPSIGTSLSQIQEATGYQEDLKKLKD